MSIDNSQTAVLQPLKLGELELANRVVMAPMTRNRADSDGVPTQVMTDYYADRAEAGLIIAEGTWPSVTGQAYCRQPGIETEAQITAWRKITDAVHDRGGKIVLQIMHAGRIGSSKIKPEGVESVAPSALQAQGEVYTDAAGMQPFDMPRALSTKEVQAVVEEHRQAAKSAQQAGFDGVELHCTSGYLPMQFLCSNTNLRTDQYGGDAAGRARFAFECLQAMAEEIGAGRVGLRINPGNRFNDTKDAELQAVSEIAEVWRTRLADISWFMRTLNEHIARQANQEDSCKGHFWEARFKSQALLDEKALLTCMAYVDLNPIRAAIAETSETSDYTSIQARIGEPHAPPENSRLRLKPFDPTSQSLSAIGYDGYDYLELVDYSGRAIRDDKRGYISSDVPAILQRLGIQPDTWLTAMQPKGIHIATVLGESEHIEDYTRAHHLRHIPGAGVLKRLFQ